VDPEGIIVDRVVGAVGHEELVLRLKSALGTDK
jgi:hypothetical protein